jgi:glycopeptide antibiotics resistance protein
MKGTIFKNVIIPLLLGPLALFFEAVLFERSSGKVGIVGFLFISSIFTVLLLLIYKRFDVCGWFAVSNCGSILIIILYALFISHAMMVDYSTAYLVMSNWSGVTLICFITKLMDKKSTIITFDKFFKLSSIIFGCAYLLILIYSLFLKSYGGTGINLIPFKDIAHDLAQTSGNILYSNTFINILLFIPFGFYLNIIREKTSILCKLGILLVIPVIIEILQYITNSGISDIDDVILNFAGELIGMFLLFVLERLYTLIRKNNKEKLLQF